MDGAPRRFSGHPFPEGLLVLDEVTGEVVLVPVDGSPVRQMRAPQPPLAALAAQPPPGASRPSRAPPPDATRLAMTELDREVIATFPYPVAKVYARLFEESDPRQQCRLLVDTFATLLKLWALQLASEYLALSDTRDAALNELLARDFSRPLISAWNVFIVRALSVFKAERISHFAPEIADAYDMLETKCKTPFMAKVRFEDAKGEARTRESKLGKVQALIKYRNGLAHGYNLPVPRAAQHLATYLPVLREILEQARFMARYPLYCIAPHAGMSPLMGARPPGTTEPLGDIVVDAAQHQLFFVNPTTKKVLGLGALGVLELPEAPENAIQGLGRDVFLFEGNTRNAVTYASALGEHVEKQSHSAVWRRCLERKAVDVAILRSDEVDLQKLRTAGLRVTNATLKGLVQSGKYMPEVAYRPPYVHELLLKFDLGDYRGLVLVGDGGSGKSTLAASVAQERQTAGDVVLFYRAASLMDSDLSARVARDLGLRDLFFEDFLSVAEPLFIEGARLRIVVDGVNEHPGDVGALIASIDAMVRQSEEHPWVRIVATARTAAYDRLPPEARFGRLEGTRYLGTEEPSSDAPRQASVSALLPLTTEEVGQIYERYRAYEPARVPEGDDAPVSGVFLRLRPNTDFRTLSDHGRSTIAMMRNPLMMRILLAAFHGRDLDAELSDDEAMRLYFEHVVVGSGRWERGAFLKAVVAELDAASKDAVERDALYQVPALKRHLQNAQKDSPYVQLLDLGVLTEHWDRDRCLIRFGFDRLFEFLLAELHERTVADAYGVLDLLRRSPTLPALNGALVFALARQCLEGNASTFLRSVQLAESLPSDAPERKSALLVGRNVIGRLARTADLDGAVTGLSAQPTAIGTAILVAAFERSFRLGEIEAAHALVDAACGMAEKLGEHQLLVSALHGKGRIQQQRGELDDALAAFARVTEVAVSHGDLVSAHRAAVRQSEILSSRGSEDEAMRLLDAAVPALRQGGALSDAAEARRQQAIVAQRKKQLPEARRLAEEAVLIAREAADPHAEAACLVTCGVSAWKVGDLEAATRWYEAAQRISEHEADVRTMVSVTGNLGVLARERRDFAAAVAWTEKSLAAGERMQHRGWIASALQNLGVFRLEAGDVAGAEKSITEALRLWTELGNGANCAHDPVMLAFFALERGDTALAVTLLDRGVALADQHDAADARLDALWIRAQLELEQGTPAAQARGFVDRFRAASDGSDRRKAQLAALDLMLSLRDGDGDAALVDAIRSGFDQASPLPELHELPIAAMVEWARTCDRRGDVEAATKARAAVKGWLEGRPHRLARPPTSTPGPAPAPPQPKDRTGAAAQS